ncbi:MAG: hypothetical protein R2714_07240 [Microthrixaceae bacterium]
MDKFLIFTVVGLTLSAVYAIVASGLVLTYATTGIFNFAHGAIGMFVAFAYWQFRFAWGCPLRWRWSWRSGCWRRRSGYSSTA